MRVNANKSDRTLQRIQEEIEYHVHTCIPAVITNTDNFASKQMVQVRPLINFNYPDFSAIIPSDIFSVPVVFPSAGGGLISFPVKVGDTVLLLFSERDISEWLLGGGEQSTPNSRRRFAMTDAIAIPGLYTAQTHLNPNPDNVEITFSGAKLSIDPSGNIEMDSPGNVTINASGNVDISSSSLTHNGKNVGHDHTHSGVQTGGGNTGVPN